MILQLPQRLTIAWAIGQGQDARQRAGGYVLEQDVPAVILEGDDASIRSGRAVRVNLGEPDDLILSVWDGPARLSDLVPLAREAASRRAKTLRDRLGPHSVREGMLGLLQVPCSAVRAGSLPSR